MIAARQRARQVSALLDFDAQDQVRIATAVSESRATPCVTAVAARIEFALTRKADATQRSPSLIVDNGPGIADFETAISGTTANGEPKLGLVTARRLMDSFEMSPAATRYDHHAAQEVCRAGPSLHARAHRRDRSRGRQQHRTGDPERRNPAAESRPVAQPGRAARCVRKS